MTAIVPDFTSAVAKKPSLLLRNELQSCLNVKFGPLFSTVQQWTVTQVGEHRFETSFS